ncbi:MAG: hypothetical protein N2053_11780, partial [Chitinispirillaceae bacterium]|nr:hypothetical protein [Chitinispirillaceae bacterium]
LKAFISPKSIDLFERHSVFTKRELQARYLIWVETYTKILEIEAKTLVEMVNTMILPAAYSYQKEIIEGFGTLKNLVDNGEIKPAEGAIADRKEFVDSLSSHIYYVRKNIKEIEAILEKAAEKEHEEKGEFFYKELKPQMEHVRKHVDALEKVMPDNLWPLPKYREMLFIS